MQTYDVIFAGGGLMGCATAYHLLKLDSTLRIALIEKDPTFEKSSTVLSDGNMRVQFNVRENILISLYGFEMLSRFSEEMAVGDTKPEIDFRPVGNLFLVGEESRETAQAGMRLQQSLGAEVEWWDASQVHERYDFIDTSNIAGGTFGTKDGIMDPSAVLHAYKARSIDLRAEYMVGEVASIDVADQQVQGVTLADGTKLAAKFVVNSAGAWGAALAKTAGVELPIDPVMRHVFHIAAPISRETLLPLIVFPSGLYLHHERENHFLVGKSTPADQVGFDFTFNRRLFMDYMWEELATYMPAFESLKLIDGWAGLYAMNRFDGNAILGEWPEIEGFILVNGFSGHGFQQCHAVGAYLADVILEKNPRIDLSAFSPQRLLTGVRVAENAHKIV